MSGTTNTTVKPSDFPELALLCWHQSPDLPMSEADAFALYERNWRYVAQDRLSREERAFIDRLAEKYGNGVING